MPSIQTEIEPPRIHVHDAGPHAPPSAAPEARPWTARMALAAWFAVNLLMLAPDFQRSVVRGGLPAGMGVSLLLAIPSSLVLTAAGWAAFRLTRRTVAGGRLLGIVLHVAAALGFSLLNLGVRKATRLLLADPGEFTAARDAGEFTGVLIVYAVLALVAQAAEQARRYRERRLAELRLQASLARAELDRAAAELRVLKLQLNPHFLFNSLHAVSALLHDAPDAAERMVLRLGDLLRSAAGRAGTQEVPLEEEVRTLEPFLEVEQIRLGGRLRVEWMIEDAARQACVPHMVLQPLVENAIKHGLASRDTGGCVQIAARRDGPWLDLSVRDDGVGLAAAARGGTAGAGIGTANTRARLTQLYGDDHALEIAPAESGGTRVSVRIPWHQAPLPGRALQGPAAEPDAAPPLRRWLARAAVAALFLVLLRRFFVALEGHRAHPARIVGFEEALVCGGLNAAAVTLLVCTAFVLARRAPVAAGSVARGVRLHARAALLVALLFTGERYVCHALWGTPLSASATLGGLRDMATHLAGSVAAFAGVSLLAHALEYARRARVTVAEALRLQSSLARAELERTSAELRGLKMQINPGFLFTALAAVASRVHGAPADAERMVVRLADLLRQAMGSAGVQEVPLEDEVRALEPFLEVERIRRDGRLRVENEVDDEALDAFVPHTLLQPLLMDAVGAAEGGGCVAVAARRRGEWLELEVRGGADADGGAAAETRGRLARLYGGRCAVERIRMDGGGARTVVRLPWHEEPWPSAPAAPLTEAHAR
jgi:two-component system LytT family sensor kinase